MRLVIVSTRLSGNYRLIVVEERRDKRGNLYLVTESGQKFVPVDEKGVPTIPDVFGKVGTDE